MPNGTRLFHQTTVGFLLASLLLVHSGCEGTDESVTETESSLHSHAVPAHMPKSLWDLSKKIQSRLALLQVNPTPETKAELNDLVSWSAEVAADIDIGEKRWTPIYEVSESIRLAIKEKPNDWNNARCDLARRLCQLAEDAWNSLPEERRTERYLGHDHAHDHGPDGHHHGSTDHEHGKHADD